MNPIVVSDDTIVQQVLIEAPAQRIFDALTNPSELLKWWVVDSKFKLIHAECDLRLGGKWLMRVVGNCVEGQSESVVHGVYLTVEPPHCLAFTWIREGEDQPETMVRWDLEEEGCFVRVRVTHSGLTSERLRARNSGWPIVVKLLQAYIEK
jgi:uncharacterized protein YndB with AHSA1/START domain